MPTKTNSQEEFSKAHPKPKLIRKGHSGKIDTVGTVEAFDALAGDRKRTREVVDSELVRDEPLSDEEVRALLADLKPIPLRPRVEHYEWETEYPEGVSSDADVLAMLPRLSPAQITYASARVRGYSLNSSAQVVGVSLAHAERWEDAPWYGALLQQQREAMFGNKHAALLPLGNLVLEHFKDALTGRYGGQIAQQTAEYVGDHIWGKSQQKVEVKQEGGMLQDLTTFLREVGQMNAQVREEQRARLQLSDGAIDADATARRDD